MKGVVVLISYRPGDPRMLEICLNAVYLHTKADFDVVIAVDGLKDNFDAWGLVRPRLRWSFHQIEGVGSDRHAAMLDEAVERLQRENGYRFLLTLDSDCFPIRDGWLDDLVKMATQSGVSGILHPFPSPNMLYQPGTLEYRILSKWCYENTHVACQLTPLQYTKQNKLSYRGDDDTGLSIPVFARKVNCEGRGLRLKGYRPTRCPAPDKGSGFDPELNRDVCVVFGDAICHVGGGSRDKESLVWPAVHFQEARDRIRKEGHARWIFEDHSSYYYRFDKEKEVADAKMGVMRALIIEHLKHNQTLFRG